MDLVYIHGRLANTTILYFLVIALWGFFRFFRKQGVDSSYWGALAIAELLVVAQGVMGLIMLLNGGQAARGGMHILYGVLTPAMIPGVYLYTKGRDERPEMLVYSAAAIIATGLIMRAIFTAEVTL